VSHSTSLDGQGETYLLLGTGPEIRPELVNKLPTGRNGQDAHQLPDLWLARDPGTEDLVMDSLTRYWMGTVGAG
jgi:hypothetical protein